MQVIRSNLHQTGIYLKKTIILSLTALQKMITTIALSAITSLQKTYLYFRPRKVQKAASKSQKKVTLKKTEETKTEKNSIAASNKKEAGKKDDLGKSESGRTEVSDSERLATFLTGKKMNEKNETEIVLKGSSKDGKFEGKLKRGEFIYEGQFLDKKLHCENGKVYHAKSGKLYMEGPFNKGLKNGEVTIYGSDGVGVTNKYVHDVLVIRW